MSELIAGLSLFVALGCIGISLHLSSRIHELEMRRISDNKYLTNMMSDYFKFFAMQINSNVTEEE